MLLFGSPEIRELLTSYFLPLTSYNYRSKGYKISIYICWENLTHDQGNQSGSKDKQ